MLNWILIDKSINGELSEAERDILEAWLAESEEHRTLYGNILRQEDLSLKGQRYGELRHQFESKIRASRLRRLRVRTMRYAAVAAIPLIMGVYLLTTNAPAPDEVPEIVPGRMVAQLSLPSGETIALSRDQSPISFGGGTISVDQDMGLVVNSVDISSDRNIILTVPRGGEYMTTLSDGTKVWLNSDSRLEYPAAFSNEQRVVRVTGEAYFEVARDRGRNFVVTTGNYDIVVTGTEFNVKCYEENNAVTTLVEGAVRLEGDSGAFALAPGQQAFLNEEGGFSVRQIDISDHISWKNGYFSFTQTPLGDIIEELSRWYDIEATWEDDSLKDQLFVARFDRNSSIGQVLDLLMRTRRVSLTLDGKHLTVSHNDAKMG